MGRGRNRTARKELQGIVKLNQQKKYVKYTGDKKVLQEIYEGEIKDMLLRYDTLYPSADAEIKGKLDYVKSTYCLDMHGHVLKQITA